MSAISGALIAEGYKHLKDSFSLNACGDNIAILDHDIKVKKIAKDEGKTVVCKREYSRQAGLDKVAVGFKVAGDIISFYVGIAKTEVQLDYNDWNIKEGTYWKYNGDDRV